MDKPRLGRGLDALLGGADAPDIPAAATIETGEVPIGQIVQNPYQPRKHFDHDQLAALSASVREHGILQPLVCRNVNGQLQLIAGERRLRAAQEVGLTKVPIRIVDFNDQQTLEAALVENIQRSDLNPIEKALGFKEHLDRFGFSHDQLRPRRLGMARTSITNLVNLLELAPEVQDGIRQGQISEAHGKILKGTKDRTKQVGLFKQIVAMGLSVKATESLLREQSGKGPSTSRGGSSGGGGSNGSGNGVEKTAHVRSLEEELRQKLGVPVEIRVQGKDAGQIVLDFAAHDDFERLLEVLRR